jgi:hypothetical protein
MAILGGQLEVQALTEEVNKLLPVDLDDLHATLGGQLLVVDPPSKVAGIMSYLAAMKSAAEAKALYQALPTAPSVYEWSRGLGVICEELKQGGIRYLSETTPELREALNNEDILHLSEQPTHTHLQIILMVVASVLRLPRELETVAATVTAILLKRGIRNFCRETEKLA